MSKKKQNLKKKAAVKPVETVSESLKAKVNEEAEKKGSVKPKPKAKK